MSLSPAILVIAGFIPSLIWLGFYYKKDNHPEPKYLLTKTFFMGLVLAPLAVIAQYIFREIGAHISPGQEYTYSVIFFLWAAFVEELVKFLAVKFVVLHNPEFDEPVDAMIYMVAAGLGFAAIENILALFQSIGSGAPEAMKIWVLRFIGATLLHAVASAVVGYFLALSLQRERSRGLIAVGLLLATVLHFIFNMLLLLRNGDPVGFISSTAFLVIVASFVSTLFNKLKRDDKLSTGAEYAA